MGGLYATYAHGARLYSNNADTLALGYFMFIGYCVPTSLLIRDGGGVHQWNIRLKNLISILYVRLKTFLGILTDT